MKKIVFLITILCASLILSPEKGFAQCSDAFDGLIGLYADIDSLITDLVADTRRNPDYHIVQGWESLEAPMAPHQQYQATCFFFATSAIIESLGFSQFDLNSHWSSPFVYMEDGIPKGGSLDLGYIGSPEHLMVEYATLDSYLSPNQGLIENVNDTQNYHFPDYPNPNPTGQECKGWFRSGQTYGFCINRQTDQRPIWMGDNAFKATCSGNTARKNACTDTSIYGATWYLNNNAWFGCSDAEQYVDDPATQDPSRVKARKIIKGFIDANVPLLGSVNQGHHWIAVIGYADLDVDSLPRKAIIADSVYHKFRVINITSSNWNLQGICSPNGLVLWNQHLDEACEPGGWATNLEASTGISDLCDPSTHDCIDRFYGIQVVCMDNGVEEHVINMYPEDPFASIGANYDCDDIVLRYSDQSKVISSARIKRFSGPGQWRLLTSAPADDIQTYAAMFGRKGYNFVTWDDSWGSNYWLVASSAGGSRPQRRTEIELTFTDGTSKTIEISPPKTYQAKIECIDDGSVKKTWLYETDHQYYERRSSHIKQTYIPEKRDYDCDSVALTVNFGEGKRVTNAKFTRYGYGNVSGINKWYVLSGPSSSNSVTTIADNLSGSTKKFTWSTSWGSDYWIVASDYGTEDRRTIFTLTLEDGTQRTIEMTPVSNK